MVTCDLLEVTNGPVGITRPIGIVSTCTCTCKFWANHTYAGGNCVKGQNYITRDRTQTRNPFNEEKWSASRYWTRIGFWWGEPGVRRANLFLRAVSFWTIYSTAHSLDLPHSLDNLSSEGARPIYSKKIRVNGTKTCLLDKQLGFGPANQIILILPHIFQLPAICFPLPFWFSHTEQIFYLSIPWRIWSAQRRGRGHSSAPMGGPFLKWWSWLPNSWLAVLSLAFLPCNPSAAHIYSPSPFKKIPGKRALHMIISWALSKGLLWSWPLLPGKSEKENLNIVQASKKNRTVLLWSTAIYVVRISAFLTHKNKPRLTNFWFLHSFASALTYMSKLKKKFIITFLHCDCWNTS